MSAWDTVPVFLMLVFTLAMTISMGVVMLVLRRGHTQAPRFRVISEAPKAPVFPLEPTLYFNRPTCWLAVRSQNLLAVQNALKLNNPKPCPMLHGLTAEEKLFIAPPVKGWILVIGSALPDPAEDVDACYRFVTELSLKLGQVQLFAASRILNYHAWAWADRGRILRAYAWAKQVLWKQGRRTPAEKELDCRCFEYGETPDGVEVGLSEIMGANVDKVPLLAARWSLDPARIDERFLRQVTGIAGEPSRRY